MTEILPFHTNPEDWAQDVAGQHTLYLPPNLLISDLDDTMLDSNRAWYEDYVRLATEAGIDKGRTVDRETFSREGPRVILTRRHNLIDSEEYSTYKHMHMHSPTFHSGIQPLDDAMIVLGSGGLTHMPGGYISTRPAVLGPTTRQSLTNAGFAPMPLLLRPEHIPYEKTIDFKIIALASLRRILPRTTVVSYVDDYRGVTDAIANLGDHGIRGVHYGSYTWQEIVRGSYN